MACTLAVVNQKGGVGKTTTAVNLAACLAQSGRQTLLVDLDPQGNATSGLGLREATRKLEAKGHSLYSALVDGLALSDTALLSQVDGLSVIPSTLDLAAADLELAGKFSRETILRRALEPLQDEFEFILIDCPPSLGLLTVNALVAAQACLVPLQCEYYALEGIAQLTKVLDLIRKELNPAIEIARIVLTMFDGRIRFSQQVVDDVRQVFGDLVSPVVVPRNVRLSEAPSQGMAITQYDPRSRGAKAYRELAQEMMAYAETRSR